MLLEENWKNQTTGTFDTGSFVQCYLSGIAYEGRQENLTEIRTSFQELGLELRRSTILPDRVEVVALVPDVILPRFLSIGLLPSSISQEIENAYTDNKITLIKIFQINQGVCGKQNLLSVQVRLYYIEEQVQSLPLLEGKVFVFTGKFWKTRDELADMVRTNGGKVVGAISKKVDYLVIGHGRVGNVKLGDLAEFKTKGTAIVELTEDTFRTLLEGTEPKGIESPEVAPVEIPPDLSWLQPGTAMEISL